MNTSLLNKNYTDSSSLSINGSGTGGRNYWKSKRSTSFDTLVTNSTYNNYNYNSSSSNNNNISVNSSNPPGGNSQNHNQVPEIQMINKFYGLIPKKFIICERVRPFTAIALKQKSTTGRPRTTKDAGTSSPLFKKLGNSRQTTNTTTTSNNSTTSNEIEDRNSSIIPPVSTRRISFEKLYRKKPKMKFLQQSRSLDQNSFGDGVPEGSGESNKESPSFQRVIRIDLNQMKWDEESLLDDNGKSGTEAKTPESSATTTTSNTTSKRPTMRKTISFDENVLEKDDEKNISVKKMEGRPASAFPVNNLPKNEYIPLATTVTTPPHWTAGKSTAERRAKLQRSFSITEREVNSFSFDGGESESEFSKYPESLVHSGRKSLHVEIPPEVDTMISKVKSKSNSKPQQQEVCGASFELELSRLIIESGALLSKSPSFSKSIDMPKVNPPVILPEMKVPVEKEVSKVVEPLDSKDENIPEIQNPIIPEEMKTPENIPGQTTNPLKSMTLVDKRKLLKKSSSLPNEKELGGNDLWKLAGKKPPHAPLIRHNSSRSIGGVGANFSGNRAGGPRVNRSNGMLVKPPMTVSIKKPLVEITRLRPKTAPPTNKALEERGGRRHQPLKARSGGAAAMETIGTTTTTPTVKPLPQTKPAEVTKKFGSQSVGMMGKSGTTTRAASTTPSAKTAKEISFNLKEKRTVPGNGIQVLESEESAEPVAVPPPKPILPRRSFSLDEGALLSYSSISSSMDSASSSSSIENSFQASKKREECVKIYEKMMKVGCGVKLQTILRGLMTPTEYNNFMSGAEREAAAREAESAAAANLTMDAGVLIKNDEKLNLDSSQQEAGIQIK